MNELAVLQAVRLKGRIAMADLAVTLGEDQSEVAVTVEQLIQSGFVLDGKSLRLTSEGRNRLGELLADERRDIDVVAMTAAYSEFRSVNDDFKALVTDWQVKNGEPNSHEDADYDAGVLARLDDVHRRVLPIIASCAAQLARLGRYSTKLQAAFERIQAGDTMWLSRPLIDSYHTVWFELHEELLVAAGLSREAEAKVGGAD